MTIQYFKTDKAIDERFLGLLEDSIYYNPQLTRDDKDSLVSALYQIFYEVDMPENKYKMPILEKPYIVPTADEAHNAFYFVVLRPLAKVKQKGG